LAHGQRIHREVLGSERAAYGEQIVMTVSRQLVADYGRGYSEKNLRRMVQLAELFPEQEIVATVSRQLSWSPTKALFGLEAKPRRVWDACTCRRNWRTICGSGSRSVRTRRLKPSFSGCQGRIHGHRQLPSRVLHKLANDLELPKLTFQVIRRTIATLAQKKGTVKDVQGLLRHSRAATTTDVYMQEIPESVQATVNAINAEPAVKASHPSRQSTLRTKFLRALVKGRHVGKGFDFLGQNVRKYPNGSHPLFREGRVFPYNRLDALVGATWKR
jgi:hypothetical protein